jgi:hypothetical protein
MINPEEVAICRRRGHEAGITSSLSEDSGWAQCGLCGMWVRAVTTIEEREDEPPKDEQSAIWRLGKR